MASDLKAELVARGRALVPPVLAAEPDCTDDVLSRRVKKRLLDEAIARRDVEQLTDTYALLQGLEVRRDRVCLRAAQRKAGGVYYTPPAIVSHTVAAVLDPLLEGRTPAEALALRIIDPTCGAGRFLIGACDHLLDWHRRHPAEPAVSPAEILRSCLFGVDIDPGAIAVAVQALHLRSGCPPEVLRQNLVCGDALHETRLGAFDAVIGNPPYVKEHQNRALFETLQGSRWRGLYRARMDICYAFIGLSLDLLRDGGRLGLITPNTWPQARSAAPLREKLRTTATVEAIVDFHDRMVFGGAGIQTMIQIARKDAAAAPYTARLRRLQADTGQPLEALLRSFEGFSDAHVRIDPGAGDAVLPLVDEAEARVLETLAATAGFQIRRDEVGQGIIGGPDAAFLHASADGFSPAERALLRPHYTSCERFQPGTSRNHIAYLTRDTAPTVTEATHPRLWAALSAHREHLTQRREVQKGRIAWFHLHWPRSEALFAAGPKLACPTRVHAPRFAVVEAPYYASRAVNMVVTRRVDVHYLCGVLNSRVVHFWLKRRGKRLGSMLQIDTGFLLGIPLPDPTQHRALAAEIAALSRRLHAAPDDAAAAARLEAAVQALYGIDDAAAEIIRRAVR